MINLFDKYLSSFMHIKCSQRNKQIFTVCFNTIIFSLLVHFMACEDLTTKQKRIIIENNSDALSARIQYSQEIIPIDTVGTGNFKRKSLSYADTVVLTLVAEVSPPEYDGVILQATDVRIKDNKAYVSYNVQGETFLGAVDIFDVSNIDQPSLLSSAIFIDTDINGIKEKSGYLYLAGATDRTEFSTPAVLEKVTLDNDDLLTNTTETMDLPSFAATDVTVEKDWIYVTSGALGGYVNILDKDTFTKHDSIAVEDARSVDGDGDDVGVVAGTPARLLIFDRDSGSLTNDWTLTGANIEFSKSTIEIKKKKAILALGDGGTQIVCIQTGTVIDSIPQPMVSDLDASVTVTNAASIDKRLLFMANGEAGVYVGISDTKFDSKDCDVDNLRLLGHFRFGDFQSVNHIHYKHDVMFVASGLGGLKILTVQVN
ncbi:MAG: hypothetical protein ACE5D0_09175 [Fidelibacterota bacterium]